MFCHYCARSAGALLWVLLLGAGLFPAQAALTTLSLTSFSEFSVLAMQGGQSRVLVLGPTQARIIAPHLANFPLSPKGPLGVGVSAPFTVFELELIDHV